MELSVASARGGAEDVQGPQQLKNFLGSIILNAMSVAHLFRRITRRFGSPWV